MKRRRAFLASAATVASGGCLGQITANPVFVLSAKTVERSESAIVPEVTVVDEEVTTESPATIRVIVHNWSFDTVVVKATGPENYGGSRALFHFPISEARRMGLTEPRNVERAGEPPCWWAKGAVSPAGPLALGAGIPSLRSKDLTFAVGAADRDGCLTPGSYHFEQRYETDDGVADVDWAFELLLSEPGV